MVQYFSCQKVIPMQGLDLDASKDSRPRRPCRCMIVWLPSLKNNPKACEGIEGMQCTNSLCHVVRLILVTLHALIPCSDIDLVAILMAAEQRLHHSLHKLFTALVVCAPYCLYPVPVEAQWGIGGWLATQPNVECNAGNHCGQTTRWK